MGPADKTGRGAIGSGGGIDQITAGTVDFGASDAPMTDEQLKQAPGKILHFPTVLGAVVAGGVLYVIASGVMLLAVAMLAVLPRTLIDKYGQANGFGWRQM